MKKRKRNLLFLTDSSTLVMLSKIKTIVLIICVLLAVFLGNAGSYAWEIHDVYKTLIAEVPEYEMADTVSK